MIELSSEERLIALELARKDFYFFVRFYFHHQKKQKWIPAEHHKVICNALMRAYRGESKKLLINIAPRSGKTQIMLYFAAWSFGHSAQSHYIMTSYSTRLAVANSWQVRQIICDPLFQEIFPNIHIDQTSSAKDNWRTLEGGNFYASGSMSALTGFGAGSVLDGWHGCIIVDDANNATDSRSEVMLQNVINWYGDTLQSRRNGPTTPIIAIQQRLSENDLSGHFLSESGNEPWDHVCSNPHQLVAVCLSLINYSGLKLFPWNQ
ncbi:MAG: terminase family protein [Pseudomonadota bacterium]